MTEKKLVTFNGGENVIIHQEALCARDNSKIFDSILKDVTKMIITSWLIPKIAYSFKHISKRFMHIFGYV